MGPAADPKRRHEPWKGTFSAEKPTFLVEKMAFWALSTLKKLPNPAIHLFGS
jgi:hypothetical protein